MEGLTRDIEVDIDLHEEDHTWVAGPWESDARGLALPNVAAFRVRKIIRGPPDIGPVAACACEMLGGAAAWSGYPDTMASPVHVATTLPEATHQADTQLRAHSWRLL